jgi:hypothetical protein
MYAAAAEESAAQAGPQAGAEDAASGADDVVDAEVIDEEK